VPQVIPRLSPFGRSLIIERVTVGRPVAHVAAELGVSRQTACRWIRPVPCRRCCRVSGSVEPSPVREEAVLAARRDVRQAPLRLAPITGVPARTISRILNRHGVAPLSWCDPLTGELIRARVTATRCERERPGELIHIDVKKLGKIPDGGGWRSRGRQAANAGGRKSITVGFGYIHAVIDDHPRLAYAEIHDNETGKTAAGVLTRAAAFFASCGMPKIERVISDNAFA
jgi:hypothetical protein